MKKSYIPLLLLLICSSKFYSESLHINSTKAFTDTTVIIDTKKPEQTADTLSKKTIVDTLLPINLKPLYRNSRFLDRKTINKSNYKYTGDIFKNLGFSFIRDYGFDGHPNENFLYGTGNNGISYFEDGILLNSRLNNYFDLDNSQSEYIDSLEVLPLTRGFLYGIYNNNVGVNFITRDFITPKPYTRIKYYQGPFGEAMIDAIFNQVAYKKFKFSIDITNRKFDSSYVNSSYSQWMVRGNIKYYFSNSWNAEAFYNYKKSLVGLNGGVSTDSLTNPELGINGNLYNERFAVVNFPFRNQNQKNHLFGLRFLGKYSQNSYTDLTFYYNFNQTELNNKTDTIFYKNIDKEKLVGANLNQKITFDFLKFNLFANVESGYLRYYSLSNYYLNYYPVEYNNYTFSPIVSASLLDSSLVPSIFFKFSHNSYKNNFGVSGSYAGFGGDLSYYFSKKIKLYLGFSNYKPGPGEQYIYNYELGAAFNYENFKINFDLFKRNNYFDYNRYSFLISSFQSPKDLLGTSMDLKLTLWKLALEAHTYYYGSSRSSEQIYQMPKFNLNGGLYFEGYLFHDNLNLKSGLSINYTGKRNEINYGEVGPDFKVDFTLAGEIQKAAYVYFTWENLFNAQYYIVPYYPMPARNIRFGIAWVLFN